MRVKPANIGSICYSDDATMYNGHTFQLVLKPYRLIDAVMEGQGR